MTYQELKDMGFSDKAIREQGIFPPRDGGKPWTILQCAEAWKIVKARNDRKVKLTELEVAQFKDMMSFYEDATGHSLPKVKLI